MELDPGSRRVYGCALCGADTSHHVRGRRGDRYGIVCVHCGNGALVTGDDLLLYQARWEEELRQILDRLTGGEECDHEGP